MLIKSDSYLKDVRKLIRALRSNVFMLIIIQYNHKLIIDDIEQTLQRTFPNRKLTKISSKGKNYSEFINAINQKEGITLITDFQEVLLSDFVHDVNQRRDKIALNDKGLIFFMPNDEKYLQLLKCKMPDWWSFQNLTLSLFADWQTEDNLKPDFKQLNESSSLAGISSKPKEIEIQRLEEKLNEIDPVNDYAYFQSVTLQLLTLYNDIAQYNKSLEIAKKTLLTAEKVKHKADIATCQSDLALVYQNLGEYEKARDLLEKALKSDIENFGEKHPNVASKQSNLALVYKDLGEYKKAYDLLENALKSDIENFGEKHPNVATSQSNLANIYKDLGEYEKACDLLEKALKSGIENFGEKHPNVATIQSNLANVYKDLGKNDKAKKLWESALIILKEKLGINHPHTKLVLEFLEALEKRTKGK